MTRGNGTAGTFGVIYRRLQKDEKVTPTAAGRYILSGRPVQSGVPAAQVRVTPVTGEPKVYDGDAIEYDTNAAPEPGKVAITTTTGELVFSAAETPTSTDTVTVTYGVGHADPHQGRYSSRRGTGNSSSPRARRRIRRQATCWTRPTSWTAPLA